jgi:2-polyprenyl-6-methoxyphenol hydroxylase-like FAD-dependent oxidoreductase
LTKRKWVTQDGESYSGRLLGVHDFPFRSYAWGTVWQALRDQIPEDVVYRTGCPIISVAETAEGVLLVLADGTKERFDVALGADRYRSTVRTIMFPGARPRYAGYLLWRGTLSAEDVPEHDLIWEPHEATASPFRADI